MKEEAKEMIDRVNRGEERVLTSVVHISEMADILKRKMTITELAELVSGVLMNDSIQVEGVTAADYLGAAEAASELGVGPNDSLAVRLMRSHGVQEVYTFDRVEGVKRVPGEHPQ